MKSRFNGKAIYNPSGKAGEYSRWACNFFTGCSNNCDYCYCKKGFLGSIWHDKPSLKKCFKDAEDAFNIFCKEIKRNIDDLRQYGLFFSFTTDPMLSETKPLTIRCLRECMNNGIPVQILTKRADFINDSIWWEIMPEQRKNIAVGFTLTGCDELEPGASNTEERMNTMRVFHKWGYPTFASIEPVISPKSSLDCIRKTADCCKLFKVGLMSGKKDYDKKELLDMIDVMEDIHKQFACLFYLKDSLLNFLKMERTGLNPCFVNTDYNVYT